MEVGEATRNIMVALHDNEECLYALEWALNHLINPVTGYNSSKFLLIYAASEAMASTPLTGKEVVFSSHVVGVLERNQKRKAHKVMEQATKLCEKHGIKKNDFRTVIQEQDCCKGNTDSENCGQEKDYSRKSEEKKNLYLFHQESSDFQGHSNTQAYRSSDVKNHEKYSRELFLCSRRSISRTDITPRQKICSVPTSKNDVLELL